MYQLPLLPSQFDNFKHVFQNSWLFTQNTANSNAKIWLHWIIGSFFYEWQGSPIQLQPNRLVRKVSIFKDGRFKDTGLKVLILNDGIPQF